MSGTRDLTMGGAKTVGIVSLGCAKNHVDSELMLGRLVERGYRITSDVAEADTIIVNTCGFVEAAKQESIEAILEAGTLKGERGRLLVAGCMVNRYARELAKEIPEIDGFVSLDDLRRVDRLVELGGGRAPAATRSTMVYDHTDARRVTTPGFAYLKVAEGCNNPCTFCAIPLWRGHFRSRTIDSVVAEAGRLVEAGAHELCLVAQDTTRYGEDIGLGRHGLLHLVEALLERTDAAWIRFLYAYPTTLDSELLRLMGEEPRICSYLDIPLQHSHPQVLRRMRRGGEGSRYLELLAEARALVPAIWLRSTFLVGFPGEEEEHFEHLLDFIRQASLDHVGAFVFSPEPGTPAAELGERAPARVAAERHRRLLEEQRPIALRRRRRLLGERLEVLVEGPCEETEHLLQGRHQGMAPEVDGRLLLADGIAAAGSLAEVEIVDAYADDLVGHIVGGNRAQAPGG